MPGLRVSIHVSIYLPTHGKDSEFVADLADLRNCLDDLVEQFTDPVIYIRGDSNVNAKNKMRNSLLTQLIKDYSLSRQETGHNTYHHFVVNGNSDSQIDVLLYSSDQNVEEKVTNIMCSQDIPDILSHHDIILSSFTIPTKDKTQSIITYPAAPKVQHSKTRIIWSEDRQKAYEKLAATFLKQARERWLDAGSQASMSMLLSITNSILTKCATTTNNFKTIGNKSQTKSKSVPKVINTAKNKLSKAHKNLKAIKSVSNKQNNVKKAKMHFNCTKKRYRQAIRLHRLRDSLDKYHSLDDIFAKPKTAFNYLKSCRKSKSSKIEKLTVGNKLYTGSAVCDGFYDSMTTLQQCDLELLRSDPKLSSQFTNYDHIIKICKEQPPIPPISLNDSTKIVKGLKKNVNDYYSITALHYLNAGQEGLIHYNCLLNALISDANNANIDELNFAHGNIFYKGHSKEKNKSQII